MIGRLLHVIGLGRLTLVDDSESVQLGQVTVGTLGIDQADEVFDKVRRVTEYGFTGVPPDDTDVVMVRVNGQRAGSVIIATSHKASRPTSLKVGDVAIYDNRGRSIKLTADGITIDGGGDMVTITNASKVRCECDIETTGDVISRADGTPVSLNDLRDAYDAHDHPPATAGASWGSGPPNEQV